MTARTSQPSNPYVSENRRVPNSSLIVHKSSIAGTRSLIVYAVYEPSSYFGPHSSLFTIEGVCCGQITSRRLPPEIDAIPVGQARFDACDVFRARNYEEAYAAILAVYPEAAEGRRCNGEIEVGSW